MQSEALKLLGRKDREEANYHHRQNHFEEWVKAGPGAEPPYEKAPPPITGT